MRIINDAGIKLIQEFEAKSLVTYKDANGFPTIGWGHRITSKDNIVEPIDDSKADELFHEDLEVAEGIVENAVAVDINDNQFSALVSLCYNIGMQNFADSTTLRLLNSGDFAGAATAFLRWCKKTNPITKEKVVCSGLLRRRQAEVALFNDPNCVPSNPFLV